MLMFVLHDEVLYILLVVSVMYVDDVDGYAVLGVNVVYRVAVMVLLLEIMGVDIWESLA